MADPSPDPELDSVPTIPLDPDGADPELTSDLQTLVHDLMTEHAAMRQRLVVSKGLMALWILVTLSGGMAIAVIWWPGGIRVFLISTLVALIGAARIWQKRVQEPRTDYRTQFKQEVIARLVQRFLNGALFQPEAGLQGEELLEGLLDRGGSRFATEDLIAGQFDGLDYALCEARAFERVVPDAGQGDTESWQRVFRGLVFAADLPSSSVPAIRLVPAKNPVWSGPIDPIEGWTRVETGDAPFDEEFLIYCRDVQATARALTPELKARLLNLVAPHESRAWLALGADRLRLALEHDEDRFEPPPLRSGGETQIKLEVERWVGEVEAIRTIIEAVSAVAMEVDEAS